MGRRLLVVEFITGGGLHSAALPEALRHEGDAMLGALLADLAQLPEWNVCTTRDARLPPLDTDFPVFPITGNPDAVWERILLDVDAVWWIAPESQGHLQRLNALSLYHGKQLFGCAPDAVTLTGNKLALADTLVRHGLPTLTTALLADGPCASTTGWVIKPIDGAGCQDTFLCRDRAAFEQRAALLAKIESSFIVQAYCAGVPASLTLLCANESARVVACNKQLIDVAQDTFCYLGSEVNAFPELSRAYAGLAERIVAVIPGLWGYVGVDLILTDHGPVIVEINPRLTTSYIGLHTAIGINPAEQVLRLPAANWWPAPAVARHQTTRVYA